MNLICKPKSILNRLRPAQRMKGIKASGFCATMLDLAAISDVKEFESIRRNNFKREPGTVYLTEHPDKLCEEAERLVVQAAKAAGLELPIALAPYAAPDIMLGKEPSEASSKLNGIYRDLAKETVAAAIDAGCQSVIVHPLFAGIEVADEWETNREFYLELARIAEIRNSDIQILLINRAKDINGHLVRGICAEPEEACKWVDELNDASGVIDPSTKPRFGFCFDVGTATLCGQDLFSTISPLGERLKAVIARDCDGTHDISMLPYTACIRGQQTDWLGLFRALRKISFDGDLIMDFADTYAAFSIMLNQHILNLGYEVGRFFEWQIGIENRVKKYKSRVLFGAGNMCREYLTNYGEDYPPLFTCDNNSSRWGEDFYGITIENPEKLRELSPDTAIFICNMYYNEISAQLKEMNLPNPIEWFNDEYMPTFHMERLAMAADPKETKK